MDMANLSSVDQFSGIASGMAGGLQNAGVVQQMIGNQARLDREAAEAPLRTRLLESQVKAADTSQEISDIGLVQKREEVAMAKKPWNPTASPIFQRMNDGERVEYLKEIKDTFGEGTPLTQIHKQAYTKSMTSDLDAFEKKEKLFVSIATREEAKALSDYSAALKDPLSTPEKVASLQKIVSDAKTKTAALKGDLTKMHEGVAINETMQKNPALFEKHPILKMSADLTATTGDLKGFQALVNTIAENETKNIPTTMAGAFIQGKMQQAKLGLITTGMADWAKELTQLSNAPKDRDHYITYEKDGSILTHVFKADQGEKGAWTTEGGGARFKPAALKVSMEKTRYEEFVKENPDWQDLPQILYNEAQANLKLGLRPFKKGSYWDIKYEGVKNSTPSATGTGAAPMDRPPIQTFERK
jgi:hypothetical protein